MLKRSFDVFLSFAALAAFSPLILVLWLAVWGSMGRPIMFRQRRVGLRGRDFNLSKLRSMREVFDSAGTPLPDDERITALGRFLRRTRLDELPQLWCILRGEMSFVGPRPLPRIVLEPAGLLEERSRVRPGLTGLAQVSGNTLLNEREKMAIDILYIDTRGLALDLKILARTLAVILRGETRDPHVIEKAMAHAQHPDRHGR